ncbi:MAG: GNAT family N-acetyltransferase, partial [Nostocales cyanobacterium ELA608]
MNFIPGYSLRQGSTLDQALLVKFMRLTYQEQFPHQDFSHLARTVEQYLSRDTPLWSGGFHFLNSSRRKSETFT